MSAQEIIAELPKLKPHELRLVKEKLSQLESTALRNAKGAAKFSDFIGIADDLPSDLAKNLDHYLHGHPKK